MKPGLPETAVMVRDLMVSFARWGQIVTAVKNVSLDVMPGEWVLLAGHNGAGKSTLLKVIGGQLRPNAGEIFINGRRIGDLTSTDFAAIVFTIHQDPLLGSAPLLTVLENLIVADPHARRSGRAKPKLIDQYATLLEPIGLAARLKQPVKLLSGGERQLLAMVIAGLREAPIILLDEPLAALDPHKTELCIELISRMHRAGKTVIHIAHDLRTLCNIADRIVTMGNGQIIKNEILKSSGSIAVR